MGLFYVWFKNLSRYGSFNQQLTVFVNQEAADEWWRGVSSPTSPFASLHLKRLSPQFYVLKSEWDGNSDLIDDQPLDMRVLEELILIPTTNAIAPTTVTNHISGKWYFIRSKADPSNRWYLRTGKACAVCGDTTCNDIHVSNEYRTKFCVQVRNLAQVPDDFVMIGSDEISIVGPKHYTLHIDDVGELKATKGYQGNTDLRFGDLKNRFITRAERQVNGEVWEYVDSVDKGSGEAWELVD